MYDRPRNQTFTGKEAFLRRRKIALTAAAAVLIASCASVTYTRTWTSGNEATFDRLTVINDAFRLERFSAAGASIFEGHVSQDEQRWVFDVVRWKPNDAAIRTFDPVMRYVYRVRRFHSAVSFLALERVEGWPPMTFIQPGDFTIGR
jgi:hypothetical protein